MEDGKVISGGMDGLICVWDKRSARCQTLNTHGGSISQVAVDAQGIGISASYDKTLVVWNFNTLQPLELMRLSNAVMHFAWHNSLAVAGDRGGEITLLDINTQRPVHQAVAHKGAVHKVLLHSDGGDNNIVASGGNDGRIVIQDLREHRLVAAHQLHQAAVNFVGVNDSGELVTGSFDKSVKVLDPLTGWSERVSMECTGGVLCGETMSDLVAVGCADGNILVHNGFNGECLFGFGADSQGGVNCLKITPDKRKLVTGGDSGIPLLLSF